MAVATGFLCISYLFIKNARVKINSPRLVHNTARLNYSSSLYLLCSERKDLEG